MNTVTIIVGIVCITIGFVVGFSSVTSGRLTHQEIFELEKMKIERAFQVQIEKIKSGIEVSNDGNDEST